jgi:hypothetical protein
MRCPTWVEENKTWILVFETFPRKTKYRPTAAMKNAILRTVKATKVGAEGFEPPPADFF